MKCVWIGLFSAFALTGGFSIRTIAFAQSRSESYPSTATVRQLMLDMIHPSSNDILFAIYRGGPRDEKEWAAVRRSAGTLAESGNMLMVRGRARDQEDWMKDPKLLVDVGNPAYKAPPPKAATPPHGLAA